MSEVDIGAASCNFDTSLWLCVFLQAPDTLPQYKREAFGSKARTDAALQAHPKLKVSPDCHISYCCYFATCPPSLPFPPQPVSRG